MKLEKLILINWGFVVSREYAFGEATLLSGATGVGKSSFQDAIQLVMTGGKQHINIFNSAQDESSGLRTSGKIRRTLATYAVGMRDNLCARPFGSHTYVGAVFVPDEGETAEPFSAIVAIEAAVSGGRGQGRSVEVARKLYFVLPGVRAMEADFIASRDGHAIEAANVGEIHVRLRQRYSRVMAFENSIEDYLCKLYAEFRGGGKTLVGPREAEGAARAFVQSIARKTVGSVDELIREQVLAEPELSEEISNISSLMQNVQRLRKIAADLAACRDRLTSLRLHADTFMASFEDAIEAELGEALRQVLDVEDSIRRLTSKRDFALAESARQGALAERHQAAQERASAMLTDAEARLHTNPTAQERLRLEDQAEALKRVRTDLAVEILAGANRLRHVMDELAAMAERPLDPEAAYASQVQEIVAMAATVDLSAGRAAVRDLTTHLAGEQFDPYRLSRDHMTSLDTALGRVATRLSSPDGLYGAVMAERGRLTERVATLQKEVADLGRRMQRLDEGRPDLPPHVELAVRYLEEHLPGARPRVLCNLVQPRDGSRWINAIEGLLGGNRYVILVDAEFEARAIRAVRHDLPGSRQRQSEASVVQGALARQRTENQALPPESILQELVIQDETARAYLTASYGRYLKVADAEALRSTVQGLTVDGMGSGGFKMFRSWLEDGELAFGAEARRKRSVRLGREVEEKKYAIRDHEARARELGAWGARLAGLSVRSLAPMVDQFVEHQRALNAMMAQLASLDDTDLLKMRRRIERARQLAKGHRDLALGAARAIGVAEESARALAVSIGNEERTFTDREHEVRTVRARLTELLRLNPYFNPLDMERRAALAAVDHSCAHFNGLRRQQAGVYRQAREAFEREVEIHNQMSSLLDERVEYARGQSTQTEVEWHAYGGIPEARRRVVAMLERLDQVRIINNASELQSAEVLFNNTFGTHFAMVVRSSVERGLEPLKRLNEKLRKLAFGEDRFEIEFGEMVKEYRKYYVLFEELNRLAETQTPVDLFSASEGVLTPDSAQAMADIRSLLLDTNRDHAQRRLKDIADYRNYRQYDIRKYSEDGREASLARMATFSGGELMTPAYLIRAAVLAQAFKQFERTPSLKLMMIDEAFDKMDEGRTAAVMRYLNESLGLQLVVAMPTRASGPLMELFSYEHRFSLMKVEGLAGELDKVTEVDGSPLKSDRLQTLWAERREAARREATLQFEQNEARARLGAGHEA